MNHMVGELTTATDARIDNQKENRENAHHSLCSFAVTGRHAHYQAIYICHDCSDTATTTTDNNNNDNNDNNSNQACCLCQACAEICHVDHDVEYLTMGRAYCDCHGMVPKIKSTIASTTDPSSLGGCRLLPSSQQEAARLGQHPIAANDTNNKSMLMMTGMDDDDDDHDLCPTSVVLPRLRASLAATAVMPGKHHQAKNGSEIAFTDESIAFQVYQIMPIHDEKQSSDMKCSENEPGKSIDNNHTESVVQTSHEDRSSASSWCRPLEQQAMTLVQHSKDTFWLDQDIIDAASSPEVPLQLCDLERLAWWIGQHHVHHWLRTNVDDARSTLQSSLVSKWGVEWWVQVKPVQDPVSLDHLQGNDASVVAKSMMEQAIDLHYDKDEYLSERFGIGIFPLLSTVTYLNAPTVVAVHGDDIMRTSPPPTVVFPYCYEQSMVVTDHEEKYVDPPNNNCPNISDQVDTLENDDHLKIKTGGMAEMLISHATIPGKHLLFDGRLLHGAPAHAALRLRHQQRNSWLPGTAFQEPTVSTNTMETSSVTPSDCRITFLVNLWWNHHPVGVQVLPHNIRNVLCSLLEPKERCVQLWPQSSVWSMVQIPFTMVQINHDHGDLDGDNEEVAKVFSKENAPRPTKRINLPFVGQNTTWGYRGSAQMQNDDAMGGASCHDDDTPDERDDSSNNIDYDDDEESTTDLVVTTYPPPRLAADAVESGTILLRFGPTMRAFLQYKDNDKELDHEEGSGT